MDNLKDFDLDIIKISKEDDNTIDPRITSKSLCTPGCITGILQTCALQTVTCGCSITGK